MRQGEILGLKWKDVDFHKGTIRVRRQVQREKKKGIVFSPPKTKSGLRTIPLGNEMLNKLREHRILLENDKVDARDRWQEFDLIFPTKIGTPISQTNLIRDFKELLQKSGLHKIRFHDLRHTQLHQLC
jgi:integrase